MCAYRFGGFEVDTIGRELRREGKPIHLEPQAFDLLVCLLEHRGQVVSKTELLDGVWGHRFMSEANLTTRVKEARRAIGDDGTRQHSIRNVRGRGYRFVAPVQAVPLAATFTPASRPSSLVGRDAELAAVVDLVARSSLVTLIGPGGVGKSTLARAVAATMRGSHANGAEVVELAAVEAGAHVLPAVARALDMVFDSDRPEEALRSIARLDALLVVDNCEHVADDMALLVDRLLQVSDARLSILATSQVRLGLSSEAVFSVTPLSVSDASQLFATRAQAARPSWDAKVVGHERVDELVSALDRLPLTIEMAAARLGSMTFDELERAIAEKSPLLQMTHRTPTPRHRSLASIVDWSTRLLEPRQRQVLGEFSVFAGRVTAADAAEVLCPDDPSRALFDLATLAERSLLVTDMDERQTRYGMLTTVGAVAERWLSESGGGDDVRRRHAHYVYETLRDIDDRLRTPDEMEARVRLSGLVDEARAAHRWAQDHDPRLASAMNAALFHAAYSSLWNEPAEWSRTLLEQNHDQGALWGAMAASAGLSAHRGELDAARKQAQAVATSTTGRLRAIGIELLADVALYEGDFDAAAAAARELQQLGAEFNDLHALAFGLVDAALARAYAGDPLGALDDLGAIEIVGLAPTDAAWLAYARGDALSLAGERDASVAFRDAIELGTTVGNRFVISAARTSLAAEIARAGDVTLALDAYAEAIDDFLRHGNLFQGVVAIRNVVGLLESVGDHRGAAILSGALANERLRPSHWAAEGVSEVAERAERAVGAARFRQWFDEGQSLDLDQAVRTMASIVDEHRTRSSGNPHVGPKQADAAHGSVQA